MKHNKEIVAHGLSKLDAHAASNTSPLRNNH